MGDLGFWRLAAEEPAACAVVAPDGTRTSRGELLAEANRVARLLRSQGLHRGDRVVGVVANETGALAVVLACQQVGAYYVPVNTALTTGEVAHILGDAAPVVALASLRHVDLLAAAAEQADYPLGRLFALGAHERFADLYALASREDDGPVPDRSPGAYLGYTSGTTGRPKGVLRPRPEGDPDDLFGAGAQWQLGMFGVTPRDGGVHLVTSPLSHTAVSGLAVTSLHFGHALVLMERFDAAEVLRLVERERVTTTHMVPTQLHRILRLPGQERTAHDLSSMRNLIHGAGPCADETKRGTIDLFGPVVWEYYGATEAAGTVISTPEWLERPGSVGRPQPGAEVRILDPLGEEVSVGGSGAVYLRMGALAFEYRGDPDKTDAGRVGDFVTVGDLGRLDDEGYLYLLGRSSEVVVSGGVNVYPAEVEAAILSHPDVEDVGVIGVPDEEWGECIAAVVQAGADSHLARQEDPARVLEGYLADRLARYKVPRMVAVVPELPRGANGKLRKHLLRPVIGTDVG
ncbi:AMP-binding protein [Nocardioides panacisoli]|uniref:AMP-binding protein n=1 Tax=Nocardioides panacisoli TaxID=627624 RepID=UPI001C62ACA3|nr:AMP-binding protein [Nocardioides panacisoli]QYJ03620.1 AMP-binding protein [Nocardioides panacisoli]